MKTLELNQVEEKLFINRYKPDTRSHIQVNQIACLICKNKECTRFCPANVFTWSNLDDELLISYENCLECGICKIGCPYGAIKYENPEGGLGIY